MVSELFDWEALVEALKGDEGDEKVEALEGESEQEEQERIQGVIDLSLSKLAIRNGWDDDKDEVNPRLYYQRREELKMIQEQYKIIRVDNQYYEENK